MGQRIRIIIIAGMICPAICSCSEKNETYTHGPGGAAIAAEAAQLEITPLCSKEEAGEQASLQDAAIGLNYGNVCLSRRLESFPLQKKVRVNPYSADYTRLSFGCEIDAFKQYAGANCGREVGLVYNGKVIGTAKVSDEGIKSCEFGSFDSMEEAVGACDKIAVVLGISADGCYEACQSADDAVCVNQGSKTF